MNILLIIFICLQVLTGAVIYFTINPIYSIVSLILLFFEAAVVLALLNFEFMSILYILIYASAVAILFLFVIMMLELKFKDLSDLMLKPFLFSFISMWAIFIISFFTSSIYLTHFSPPISELYNLYAFGPAYNEIFTLAQQLYGHASLCFLLAGIILLLALLGSILLVGNTDKKSKCRLQNDARKADTGTFFN